MSVGKRGLVLEGGAMRGLFTAGVLDVLMEKGVAFDGVIGVSAGAAFGSNLVSGQIGRSLRYNLAYCRDKRYCSLRSLLRTGDLFGAEFCYRTLPLSLDLFDFDAYRESPTAFYAVATDVDTGEAVYLDCKGVDDPRVLDAIRASASMPLVSRPVSLDGRRLLDGGVSDSVPLEYFESIGYTKNLVVLTKPLGYRRKRASRLACGLLRRYPGVARAMRERHIRYNETLQSIERREAAGEILVIRPDVPLPIGRTSHSKSDLQAVYDLGRAVAERRLDDLLRFLKA